MKFPNFCRVWLFLTVLARLSYADPSITNVTAGQRYGTRLVDITYDLVSPNGPSTIAVEVSDNGGVSYLVPATSFSGHVGAGITTGVARKITWNAGIDRPGQLSPNVRFRVSANDGYPSDASYDPSTLEFINRSLSNGDPVTAGARVQLDLFVRECKRLGFWNTMDYVPCRLGYGALNTLGGSPKRTNAKFVRTGTTSMTTAGVKFNQGSWYVNHVETPFNWNPDDEPVFVGVLGYVETGPDYVPYYAFLRQSTGSSYVLGTYNSGRGVAGFQTASATGLQFYMDNNDFTTLKKPNFMGGQFDGTGHTMKCVLGDKYGELTHETAVTGRPNGKLWFMQATDHLVTDVLQGLVLFYGDVGTLPMQSFYNLQASTLLDDTYSKTIHLHLGGQSNAQYELLTRMQKVHWLGPTTPLFQTSYQYFPGAPISQWIGNDPLNPVRQASYQTQKNVWLARKPLVVEEKWDAVFVWVQGESDTEQEALALAYYDQLRNYVTFLRQDMRQDLLMAIGLIDYTVLARTSVGYGNITVSGCGGAGATGNGVWSITPYSGLANANITYDWTRSGTWRVTKDGGTNSNQWRIHSDGVTYYLGAGSEAHPRLVTSWTALNGATGAPVIAPSRTGNIELVRKAQRDFVAQDSRAIMFDSRGCERGKDTDGADDVHMTVPGHQAFADRFAAAYQAFH